jgi:hypothetical protein
VGLHRPLFQATSSPCLRQARERQAVLDQKRSEQAGKDHVPSPRRTRHAALGERPALIGARTSNTRNRGRGQGGPLCWSRRSGPHVLLFCRPWASPAACLSAVCRSAATASPPVRATLSRARRVKAAQEDELKGGGALALALTAVLGLRSRTEAASSKGVERA